MPALVTRICSALALGCALAACTPAVAPAPAIDPTRIVHLEQSQADLDQRLQRLQDNLVLLEGRFADQQKMLAEFHQELQTQKGTPGGQITPSLQPPAATGPTPEPRPQPAAAEVYRQAFADYAGGRYPQAVTGFSRFLAEYSASDYAGNAQYWLGECYLGMKQYDQAIRAFEQTADRYPESAKAADALLKLAETQRLLGSTKSADDTLRRLRSRYPDSPAAHKSQATP
jgi:tol-pal system protein YbgF